MRRLRGAWIEAPDGRAEANFSRSWVDQVDGLYRAADLPFLMDFHWALRPVTINAHARLKKVLPRFGLVTFGKDMFRRRQVWEVPAGSYLDLDFDERFVLEVPLPDTAGLLQLSVLKFTEFERK